MSFTAPRWRAGALLLLSLGLQGCQEDLEICVMKQFPTAETDDKRDMALGGPSTESVTWCAEAYCALKSAW